MLRTAKRIENIEITNQYGDENVIHVEIEYPKAEEHPINTVEIGLTCVRATDNIRITYDYERDGWVILQPRETHPLEIDENGQKVYGLKTEWIEAAFCPAWQFELSEEEKFEKK